MISRRILIAAALTAPSLAGADEIAAAFPRRLAALEAAHGGRLGVAIGGKARVLSYRGDERFPMCSTWKAVAVGFVLSRADRDLERLDRRIVFGANALVPYSPITGRHIGGEGLSLAALCEAAITVSDNTAANLLLDSFGGPPALTGYMRTLGDVVTRLDRREPDLNEAAPGDPRDTTSPNAMRDTLGKLLFGPALSAASRDSLAGWLQANTTGAKRLRAGLPADWRIGDKTGSGDHATSNDVAALWPPGRAPSIVTAFYTGGPTSEDERDIVLAEVGRLAAAC